MFGMRSIQEGVDNGEQFRSCLLKGNLSNELPGDGPSRSIMLKVVRSKLPQTVGVDLCVSHLSSSGYIGYIEMAGCVEQRVNRHRRIRHIPCLDCVVILSDSV